MLKTTVSQLSPTGNLHFSYLKMSDMQDGKLYKCNVYNPYLDFTRGGSYTRLHITPGTVMLSPYHFYGNAEAFICGISTGEVDMMKNFIFERQWYIFLYRLLLLGCLFGYMRHLVDLMKTFK